VSRGWIDRKTDEACVVVGTHGFVGTYEHFLECCQRRDASSAPFCRLHHSIQPCPICLGQTAGWDANGSPVEAL
jgi:hypothetical protein